MPTKTDLDLAGEFSLGSAIEKLGGYPAVAAIFGLAASRISLHPRSRDELILAHELNLFFPIDMDDHKIQGKRKAHEVDIVVRILNLIVEYDSHYRHQEKCAHDSRKTEDPKATGWTVIRVRESPLDRLHPSDVVVRKGRFKETCNRVLLRIQEIQAVDAKALERYIAATGLQNSAACESLIADILRTKRGQVVEDSDLHMPDGFLF